MVGPQNFDREDGGDKMVEQDGMKSIFAGSAAGSPRGRTTRNAWGSKLSEAMACALWNGHFTFSSPFKNQVSVFWAFSGLQSRRPE
jgi:hypothetical protein